MIGTMYLGLEGRSAGLLGHINRHCLGSLVGTEELDVQEAVPHSSAEDGKTNVNNSAARKKSHGGQDKAKNTTNSQNTSSDQPWKAFLSRISEQGLSIHI